jgi:Right handed beta helix region
MATRPATPRRRRGWLLLAAAALLVATTLIGPAPSARASTGCDMFAAPSGSDSNPGTVVAPFQTAQKLVSSLAPGQTGCLRAGTYTESVSFRKAGTGSAPITLTAYPGETATIVGRVFVAEGADYTTVTGLNLDGVNAARQQSPMIDANHVTFSYDDVTNDHTGICFGIGSATWGWSTGTLITHDRVHDCGQMTPDDNYQHGFYIGGATDTTIEWSLIYANAARGIQLYPEADYTTIDHNIIDSNGTGIIISGADGVASSYTNVYDNVISDATQRHDVESWWPAGNPVGVGNTVHDNCVWGGREGTIDTSGGGFTAQNNIDVNPQFAAGSAQNYAMSPSSGCLALVGDVQAAVDRTTPTVPAGSGGGASGSGGGASGSGTGGGTAGAGTGAGKPASGGSGSTGSAAPSGAGAVRAPSPLTAPASTQPASAPSAPASRPTSKHTTRKPVVRGRAKHRKPPAKRHAKQAAERPAPRPTYPSLRRLP